MGKPFFVADLVKVSVAGPDVPVHFEVGYPERERDGLWVAPLLIVTNQETRHRCVGEDPQHAIWVALERLYAEFKIELDQGCELVRANRSQPCRLNQQLKEAIDVFSGRVHIPLDLLAKAQPSGDALLDLLRPLIDDSMLREIAEADYGIDVDVHFGQLLLIRDAGRILDSGGWHPSEVLELIRWSQPDDPKWRPGATGTRGHLMRAFACAVLLRSSVAPGCQSYDFAVAQTLYQLLESVASLADDAEQATASFLAWLVERAMLSDRAICALAFLSVALSWMRDRWSDEDISQLANWVAAEEARTRTAMQEECDPPWSWFWHQNWRCDDWKSRAQRLLDEAATLRSDGARRSLEELAMQILTAP
jgi:hypothetical protein